MFASIPLAWKVGAIVFGLLAFISGIGGTYLYTLKFGESKGRTDCEFKIVAAQNETLLKSAKALNHEISKLQSIEDSIRKDAAADDRPVSPVLRNQLERMRQPAE